MSGATQPRDQWRKVDRAEVPFYAEVARVGTPSVDGRLVTRFIVSRLPQPVLDAAGVCVGEIDRYEFDADGLVAACGRVREAHLGHWLELDGEAPLDLEYESTVEVLRMRFTPRGATVGDAPIWLGLAPIVPR